jgi:putative ATPase
MSLFAPDMGSVASPRQRAPLAERMRPRSLEEFFGQSHLLGAGMPLRLQIENDDSASLIFWGPPGVGKTTLAKIIANVTSASFIEFSAVLSGIKEIKQVMVEAEKAAQFGSRTILFVDEIHRFNKAQQDAFLPYVERGSIRLIGATTENPSFEINAALLSRCRVYTLRALEQPEVIALLERALRVREAWRRSRAILPATHGMRSTRWRWPPSWLPGAAKRRSAATSRPRHCNSVCCCTTRRASSTTT